MKNLNKSKQKNRDKKRINPKFANHHRSASTPPLRRPRKVPNQNPSHYSRTPDRELRRCSQGREEEESEEEEGEGGGRRHRLVGIATRASISAIRGLRNEKREDEGGEKVEKEEKGEKRRRRNRRRRLVVRCHRELRPHLEADRDQEHCGEKSGFCNTEEEGEKGEEKEGVIVSEPPSLPHRVGAQNRRHRLEPIGDERGGRGVNSEEYGVPEHQKEETRRNKERRKEKKKGKRIEGSGLGREKDWAERVLGQVEFWAKKVTWAEVVIWAKEGKINT